MNILNRTLLPVVVATLCTQPALAQDSAALQAEAQAAIKSLAQALNKEMKSAMQSDGPIAAINTCNTKALPLTADISEKQGLQVARTSLKYRNPSNAPDAWEQDVLARFEQRHAQGEDLKTLVYSEVIEEQGQRYFRLMKAIPVQERCETCHGKKIAPELAGKLDELYPHDRARGFVRGDLRGAFTVKKAL